MRSVSFFAGRPTFLRSLDARGKSGRRARCISRPGFAFPGGAGVILFLDCLLETPSALIGIESKRFEPFRSRRPSSLSDAYWRLVWGDQMGGYERIRDGLSDNPEDFAHLDVAQLFKHAFALRSEVHRRERRRPLRPILFYLYAEPEVWPASGEAVDERAKARHRNEIETFGAAVANDEVSFVSCPWRRLLDAWVDQPDGRIRAHAQAVTARFSP